MPHRRRSEIIKEETEEVCVRVCFFVPQLPDAALFRKWLPKHRHILFGHFGYWITASLITAGAGTSLKTKCSNTEPLIMLVFLIITGIIVSLAKLFAPGGFKKNFGPTIVSFLMMFATGLALHQKPLICGFTSNSRRISIREQAMMWGIMVSLQVAIMIGTMLSYLLWHLKHKDEKREAELAGSPHMSEKSDEPEPGFESDEDSLQASPASVRWTARPHSDDELSNSVWCDRRNHVTSPGKSRDINWNHVTSKGNHPTFHDHRHWEWSITFSGITTSNSLSKPHVTCQMSRSLSVDGQTLD